MTKLPKYCSRNANRTRNNYIRFVRGTFSTYLTGEPWSEEFMKQYADALKGIKRSKNFPDSFWKRVDKSKGKNGCWPWMKYCDREGYGRVSVPIAIARYERGDNYLTHRYAWELTHGKIPKGKHVLHHCDNPPCCNPAHLWLGTHQDNMDDRQKKGRWKDHWNM
jgi:hypothetical protein